MTITKQTAYGYSYFSISLQAWRGFRTLHDIPREYWAALKRPATNFELRNRIDYRDGAWPQLGGIDHIGAGFQDDYGVDTGSEALCAYGLNPNNTRASWNAGGDSDTICLLLPGDTRPWQHGVINPNGYDLNSWGVGYEDGILKTDWTVLPRAKRLAHLRIRAAFWALFFETLNWEMKYTPDPNEVWRLIGQRRSWGLTQHGIMDPNNRTDAGLVWRNGVRINTFPYFTPVAGDPADATLFGYIREERAIRTGTLPGTPGLPTQPDPKVTALQTALNEFGYNLDTDGLRGPLTDAAVDDLTEFTGWIGDKTNHTALMAHLEDTMAKLNDLFNKVSNIEAQNAQILEAQTHLPGRTVNALRRSEWKGANNARFEDMFGAIWLRTSRVDPATIQQAVKDALKDVPGGNVVDTDALGNRVVDILSERLATGEEV